MHGLEQDLCMEQWRNIGIKRCILRHSQETYQQLCSCVAVQLCSCAAVQLCEEVLGIRTAYCATPQRVISYPTVCRRNLAQRRIIKVKNYPVQRWANSVFSTEYEYYSGSELWSNTNTIQVQKFGRIRIRILFGVPLLSEYEYLDYLNSTEYQ